MMRDAESPRGSNPRSTSIIWTTLRIISPQPTSSTSEPASSNAISALRTRRMERPSVATRASCRSAFVRPRPHAVSGARESATAASRQTTPTIASTVVSSVMPDAAGAGRPSCVSTSGASVPSRNAVSATPSASAAPQMSDVSASSIRTTCRQAEPSARRTATSRCRCIDRSSMSTATLAQTMTSTSPDAAVTPNNTGLSVPSHRSRADSSCTPLQSPGIGDVAALRAASVSRCSAAAGGIPSRSRTM